jgi:predicted XRE-type DNA-binding protein
MVGYSSGGIFTGCLSFGVDTLITMLGRAGKNVTINVR